MSGGMFYIICLSIWGWVIVIHYPFPLSLPFKKSNRKHKRNTFLVNCMRQCTLSLLEKQGRAVDVVHCHHFTLHYWILRHLCTMTLSKSKWKLTNGTCLLLSPFLLHPVQLLLRMPKFLILSLNFFPFHDFLYISLPLRLTPTIAMLHL